MEVALFPIAALLLLLSGAGGASSHQPATATIVRALLANVAQAAPAANRCSHSALSTGSGSSFSDARYAVSPLRTPLPLHAVLSGSTRVQYRTRFGTGTGVYFAVGPPATVFV